MIAKSSCSGWVRSKRSHCCSSTASPKWGPWDLGPSSGELGSLGARCRCTPWGTRHWGYPLPGGGDSPEHSAGCGEGLQRCSLPHRGKASPLGDLGEDPKSSFWTTGSQRWGSGSPWRPGQHNFPSKLVSRYLITDETRSLVCCFVPPWHSGAAVALA